MSRTYFGEEEKATQFMEVEPLYQILGSESFTRWLVGASSARDVKITFYGAVKNCVGVFTLPDTETDTDTDKKCVVKNCVGMFTLHLHNNAIEYC